MAQVVVTGIGAVSPYGESVETLWRGLLSGETAIRSLELFDTGGHRTSIAASVPGAPGGMERHSSPLGRRARMTRTDLFAVEATREALACANLDSAPEILERAGLFFGTSSGGMFEAERALLRAEGSSEVPRYSPFGGQAICSPTTAVGGEFGIGGPTETVGSACAASTMAIEAAFMSISSGESEVAIAGGSDALCELTYSGFNSLRAVDEQPSRPFRANRGGLSLGEGSGVLILETLEHARARGVRPLAVLAGTGTSCDAHHMTAPHPEGEGAWSAMAKALEVAGEGGEGVDFVNAHGTGTPHNDAAEHLALQRLLGARAESVPVTSTKGSVGHLLGSCGALEAVVTVRSLLDGQVPQTPGEGPVDETAKVNLVLGEPMSPEPCRAGLSVNLAFGGANAAILLRSFEEEL